MDFDNNQLIKQLRKTISIMEVMCNSIDESIILLDNQSQIKWCNSIFCNLINHRQIEILGKPIYNIFHLSNMQSEQFKDILLNLNTHKDKLTVSEFIYVRNGKELSLDVSIIQCNDEQEQLFVVIFRDVTEQKKIHQQLEHLAHYDLLTNLPNRLQLETFFKCEMAKAERHERKLAVFFIDLNKFKEINDVYGHHTGDLALKMIAERLLTSVRSEDFVARIGGDEFVVISEFNDNDIATQISQKMKTALDRPYQIFGNTLNYSASIGVSFYPDDAKNMIDLIKIADQRMYEAKKSPDR
ncbi:MAG: hypothetical protein A3F13_07325 [Gammaproteobacteria bacterium RIFCSPHIGHO2_12_FULL_40_19]|nr:MAG: hypothetical protein A3F13_07325 [Gammaproteobacteria bacterium RIFCSPHIGHO2_12_FULL_40_19]